MNSNKIVEYKLTDPDFNRSVQLCGYMHAGALGWELTFDEKEPLRMSPEQFERYLVDVGFRLSAPTTETNLSAQLINVVQYLLLKRLQQFHSNAEIPEAPIDNQTGERSGNG